FCWRSLTMNIGTGRIGRPWLLILSVAAAPANAASPDATTAQPPISDAAQVDVYDGGPAPSTDAAWAAPAPLDDQAQLAPEPAKTTTPAALLAPPAMAPAVSTQEPAAPVLQDNRPGLAPTPSH